MTAGLTRDQLAQSVRKKIRRPLFAVLVGDHLTGVASQGAAYKLHGAMLVPLRTVLGLRPVSELKEREVEAEGWQLVLSFQDLRAYLDMVARRDNTRYLEQLYSPHVIITGPEHESLKQVARPFLNRSSYHDFRSRAREARSRLDEEGRLSDLLECARLLMCGAHALRSGEIQLNVVELADLHDERWLRSHVKRQETEPPSARLNAEERQLVTYDLDRLQSQLDQAHEESKLLEDSGSVTELDNFLVELRLRET